MKYRYPSRPKVVRLRLDFSFVQLIEYLACRCFYCSQEWRWESWTVDTASHTLRNGHRVGEHRPTDLAQQPPKYTDRR